MKFGKVTRPILGIKFAPDQSVEQLGVSGVLVLDAPARGPAGKAVCTFCSFLLRLLQQFKLESNSLYCFEDEISILFSDLR